MWAQLAYTVEDRAEECISKLWFREEKMTCERIKLVKIQICLYLAKMTYKLFLLLQGKNLTILKTNLNEILQAHDLEKKNKTKITLMWLSSSFGQASELKVHLKF